MLKKNKYFSVGVATSLVNLPQAELDNNLYVYLNMKGGQIFHVYQSDHIQFKGVIGYELDGFYAKNGDGFLTADGNFAGLFGVIADYEKKGTKVHTALTYETNFGLKNQNLMSDMRENFGKFPTNSNVNYLMFNAVSLDANISQKLNNKTTLVSNNNLTMTSGRTSTPFNRYHSQQHISHAFLSRQY